MSNMSYCRFQNTSKDLRDCHEALDALITGDDADEALSREELDAAQNLIQTCLDIARLVTEEVGHDCDLDVSPRKITDALKKLNDARRDDA